MTLIAPGVTGRKPGESKRVLTFKAWCELNGISPSTGRKILKSGRGPKITQLSANRIGIRVDHNEEWQNSLVR